MQLRFLQALPLVLLTAAPVRAQDTLVLERLASGLPAEIQQTIRTQGASRFLQRAAQTLFTYSPDGVLTSEAIEIFGRLQLAERRAQHLQGILRYDLNGDMALSRDEFEALDAVLDRGSKASLALLFIEGDLDKDGVLSIEEVGASYVARDERSDEFALQLLGFDVNADGRVDLLEISSVANAVRPEAPEPPAAGAECDAPPVPKGAEVVLLSGYTSYALSTVAVSGKNNTTFAASVEVEPGDDPLYVFAVSFQPIVWSFTGATERIQTLVVQPPKSAKSGPGAAVAGIAASRVHFVPASSCLPAAVHRTGRDLNEAGQRLARALDARVSSLVTDYYLTEVKIPSGNVVDRQGLEARLRARYAKPEVLSVGGNTYRLSAEGMVALDQSGEPVTPVPADPWGMQEMVREFPAGVAIFDPATLVSSGPVKAYDILPVPAGLLQLLADGRVEVIGQLRYRAVVPIDSYPPSLFQGTKALLEFADGIMLPKSTED
jgi:hypothetical protein